MDARIYMCIECRGGGGGGGGRMCVCVRGRTWMYLVVCLVCV